MISNKRTKYLVVFIALCCSHTFSQETTYVDIPLTDFRAFNQPDQNWVITSDFDSDFTKPWNLKRIKPGSGVALNNYSEKTHGHLVTNKEFGDLDLEFDFMMDKGSNSGIYLQGRYEIQLFDSWLKSNSTYADCGGIYQRWNEEGGMKGYEGVSPLVNASYAPGLWQHLRIIFKAPKFDDKGNKVANARFNEVYLNGVLIHNQVEVSGPTRASLFHDEKSLGPLMFQGDHGKVALRNIRYRSIQKNVGKGKNSKSGINIIKPIKRPYLLRSFIMFKGEKLNKVISLGHPSGLSYAYNLEKGALLKVWRGNFMDVTDMWHHRGQAQLAKPLGNTISLSNSPAIALLSDFHEPWPDSIAPSMVHQGYALDKNGVPKFTFNICGVNLTDYIVPLDDGMGFERTLTLNGEIDTNLYSRIISAESIVQISKEVYRVDGNYYVMIDKKFQSKKRETKTGQELLVNIGKVSSEITYSIIY
ncbi:protein of unknown function [Zobellia uliginosa]|uniref:3-keto-alpha-glucoside-1,2-lyase/3-keto-2-hydroxy-glucal hydratase domain-containing protein n=1 Tax=Zobellia uliginosa TaxID=143224 RepID=A0ABY1KNR8_9FLAO|nr:DUF1080 domain-containing protein [Zobellia uliginosa]SIS54636.1 protein of unknown function [Zobellia uliginosa]